MGDRRVELARQFFQFPPLSLGNRGALQQGIDPREDRLALLDLPEREDAQRRLDAVGGDGGGHRARQGRRGLGIHVTDQVRHTRVQPGPGWLRLALRLALQLRQRLRVHLAAALAAGPVGANLARR